MADPLAIVLPIAFNEAIKAADARNVVLPEAYYGELQGAARSQAFSVAGLSSIAQLQNVLDHMNAGLRSGMSFGEWKKTAAEADWNLPEHRLDLILRMHTQTAYQAGHWQQFDRLADTRGFLMYSAINDSRTRPAHRAMDGVIRPVGDLFWNDHSPPCGYNCRCSLISLTADQADARGGETTQISPDARADPGFGGRPLFGLPAVAGQVERAVVGTTGTFQDTLRAWYESISQEKVIERVQNFVGPEYATLARDVRAFVEDNDGLVAEHEAVAIREYSAAGYRRMNAFLRAGGGDDMNTMAVVASASSGLSKLPAFEGRVYRGLDLSEIRNVSRFLEKHQPGEILEYQGFTSASYNSEAAFAGDVQYVIHSLNGRVIEHLAYGPLEREVLFMPGTKFKVLDVSGSHPMRLELQEVEDQSVAVPDSNKFEQPPEPPKSPAKEAIERRMADESQGVDPEVLAKFRAEHDGMTPLEYALSRFPSARLEIQQHAPHLLPKKSNT